MNSPETDQAVSSSLSAARVLAALDTHGPKVAVYLIVAQLLGVFEWASQSLPGVCG
jgi:hypothetical protein